MPTILTQKMWGGLKWDMFFQQQRPLNSFFRGYGSFAKFQLPNHAGYICAHFVLVTKLLWAGGLGSNYCSGRRKFVCSLATGKFSLHRR